MRTKIFLTIVVVGLVFWIFQASMKSIDIDATTHPVIEVDADTTEDLDDGEDITPSQSEKTLSQRTADTRKKKIQIKAIISKSDSDSNLDTPKSNDSDEDNSPDKNNEALATEKSPKAEDQHPTQGNSENLLEHFRKLFEENPNSDEYKAILDLANASPEQLAESELILTEALNRQPENPELNLALAKTKKGLGKTDEAVALLEKSIELDPTNNQTKYELADSYTFDTKSNPEEALTYYQEALDSASNEADKTDILNGLAAANLNAGNYEKATEIWEEMVEAAPDNSVLQSNLCESQFKSNQSESAVESCQRAIEIDKGNSEAYYQLAINLKEQNPDEAKALIQKALLVEPENETYKALLQELSR